MNLTFDLSGPAAAAGGNPGGGGRRDRGGRHAHGGASLGRRPVAGDERLGAAGVAALEPLGHHAGPGRHVADRLGGRDRGRRQHVGHGRFDRTGPGPGSGQANGSSSDSGDEPSEEAEPESPAIVERAAAWERLAIGLERSWERARAVILELDGRSPAAENQKPTVPPAAGRQPSPPVPAPARPTTSDRTGAQARPTASSEAAIGRSPPADGSIVPSEARGHRPGRRCRAGRHGRGSSRRWTVGTLGRGIVGQAGPGPIS